MEIAEAVGEENAYIFGAREEQLPELKRNYDPKQVAADTPGLMRVLDALVDGTLDDNGSGAFHDIRTSLLDGFGFDDPDVYYTLGDFADYRDTRDRMAAEYYADPDHWAKMCWITICASGRFSSDRTIRDYAEEVWKIEPCPVNAEHNASTAN